MRRLAVIFLCVLVSCFAVFGDVGELPPGESAITEGLLGEASAPLCGWSLRGESSAYEVLAPQKGSPSPVLAIRAKKAPQAWQQELNQRVSKAIPAGSTMYVTFDYKISAGYSFCFYWQEETSPWDKLMSINLMGSANAWHTVRLKAPVLQDLDVDATGFSFHLSGADGSFFLRDFHAVIVPATVDHGSIDANQKTVIGGDFKDLVWASKIHSQIDVNHSRKVTLTVMNAAGEPVSDAEVSYQLKMPAFWMGVTGKCPLLYPELLQLDSQKELRDRIGDTATVEKYHDVVLKTKRFSRFICQDAFSWQKYTEWGNGLTERLLDDVWAEEKIFLSSGIFLSSFDDYPDSLRELGYEELRSSIQDMVKTIVTGQAKAVPGWCLLQDPLAGGDLYDYLGPECLADMLKLVRTIHPNGERYICDSTVLTDISPKAADKLVAFLTWLKERDELPTGLWLDASMRSADVIAPQEMQKRIQKITAAFPSMPITIVNLAVNTPREDAQASMIQSYLWMFCAMPQVKGVALGELWSPVADKPDMGYLRRDYSPKMAMRTVLDFLAEKWPEDVSVITNANGVSSTPIMAGLYDVRIKTADKETHFFIQIPETGSESESDLDFEHGRFSMKMPAGNSGTIDVVLVEPAGGEEP